MIGIDRFMSEARSVTNIIGNGLATVVVSKMSGEFDAAQADAAYAERFGAGVKFNLRPVAIRQMATRSRRRRSCRRSPNLD